MPPTARSTLSSPPDDGEPAISQPTLFLALPSDILFTITDNLILADLFVLSQVSHACRLLSHKAIFARHELDLIEFYSDPKPNAAINLQGFLLSTHTTTSEPYGSHTLDTTLLTHIHTAMLSEQVRYDEDILRKNLQSIVTILIKDGMLTRSSTPHHVFLLRVLKYLPTYISPPTGDKGGQQNTQALATVRDEIPNIVAQGFMDLLNDTLVAGQLSAPASTATSSPKSPAGTALISFAQRKRAHAHLQSLTQFLFTCHVLRHSQDGSSSFLSEDSVLAYLEHVSKLLDSTGCEEDAVYKINVFKRAIAQLQKLSSTRLMEALKERFPEVADISE
ncbi:hypothetical protein BC936DRAFT_138993 [Jimgerdemannia flammicorona]|uniref:Uncharacterized protein n=2 Tax=Jimgerdemannia flammicorona TaxID=994334 RepID=A0A433DI05_9FUNG|nr:hypothetical protein BC936DRAFT_138993 [Jimgerdemannia flammicorona]RUS31987.1 hypothetical protein BC938DRAFT_476579 [Jimgerdemannia flammicorona]